MTVQADWLGGKGNAPDHILVCLSVSNYLTEKKVECGNLGKPSNEQRRIESC